MFGGVSASTNWRTVSRVAFAIAAEREERPTPGAVPSPFPEDQVHGVLYRVHTPEPIFSIFDDYEACTEGWPEPYEFLLRPIDVTLDNDQVIRAASYLYTWDTSRAAYVPSGRFTDTASNTR